MCPSNDDRYWPRDWNGHAGISSAVLLHLIISYVRLINICNWWTEMLWRNMGCAYFYQILGSTRVTTRFYVRDDLEVSIRRYQILRSPHTHQIWWYWNMERILDTWELVVVCDYFQRTRKYYFRLSVTPSYALFSVLPGKDTFILGYWFWGLIVRLVSQSE